MKFVFASDSFKGTLSSARVAEMLEQAAKQEHPDCTCVKLLLGDGGEGTLDAIAQVREGRRLVHNAFDALMRPIQSEIFLAHSEAVNNQEANNREANSPAASGQATNNQAANNQATGNGAANSQVPNNQAAGYEAFVETAKTCGLTMLAPNERNPLATSSYGVGQAIAAALDAGANRITMGLGGSSINDGGMGCLQALGVQFFDQAGETLAASGEALAHVARIDTSALDPRLQGATITIMCDVDNPLLGPRGATQVFGLQKGADQQALQQLEAGMQQFVSAAQRVFPQADFTTPGYGAAGGLGMALSLFCGAHIERGIDAMLRWAKFEQVAAGADLVITGEGQMDAQSLEGKVPLGVLAHAKQIGVPVVAICGRIAGGEEVREQLLSAGYVRIIEAGAGQSVEEAMAHAEENYARAAQELFQRYCQ